MQFYLIQKGNKEMTKGKRPKEKDQRKLFVTVIAVVCLDYLMMLGWGRGAFMETKLV